MCWPIHEGLLYALSATRACVAPRQFHDVVGYDHRIDVFKLTVDRTRRRPLAWRDASEAAPAGEGEEVTSPPE